MLKYKLDRKYKIDKYIDEYISYLICINYTTSYLLFIKYSKKSHSNKISHTYYLCFC